MTRSDVAKLFIGNKLELADGSMATVKGIDHSDETVTFQYDAMPSPMSAPAVAITSALGGYMSSKIMSSDGALNPVEPPVDPPVKALEATKTTTVRCKWIELVNAAIIKSQ